MDNSTDNILILYDAQFELYNKRAKTLQMYLLKMHQLETTKIGLELGEIKENIKTLVLYKAIIPFGIKLTSELSKHRLANVITTKNPETILMLDDKAKMTYVNFAPNSQVNIPQIPTLVMASASEDEIKAFGLRWKNFIFKPIDGASSAGLIYCEKEELLSLDKGMEKYILQPCIAKHNVYLVGVFAHFEQLAGLTMYFLEGGLHPTDYGCTTYHQYIDEMDSPLHRRMASFVSASVKHLKLNGLFQFQFLQDANTEDLYLMEVNPRICGTSSTRTKNGICPEVEKLIVPYLKALGCRVSECEEEYVLFENDMVISQDINEMVKDIDDEIGQKME